MLAAGVIPEAKRESTGSEVCGNAGVERKVLSPGFKEVRGCAPFTNRSRNPAILIFSPALLSFFPLWFLTVSF
jgi:hypothetical protein